MERCLDLAVQGLGYTSPNPMVGALLVVEGEIVGEGYHERAGMPHAEPNAIASVADKSLLHHSTLYVNLEPCAHYGKTAPCSELIIKNKIPRVVVAMQDPFEPVSGRGIAMLKDAGVEVKVGILEKEAKFLNRRFLMAIQQKRPWIILKWAETADGYIDRERTPDDAPLKVSSEESSIQVHKLRASEDAILVGGNTAYMDNPSLTVRLREGDNPIRVVLDERGDLPLDLNLFTDGEGETILFTKKRREELPQSVEQVIMDEDQALQQLLDELYKKDIRSLIVEGGAKTLKRFIDQGYWDECYRYRSNTSIGSGVKAPKMPDQGSTSQQQVGEDTRLYYINALSTKLLYDGR